MRWETVLHGNAGEMGKYAVLSVLPDKIARYLYEYHDTSYTSLALPALPLDRSTVSVHAILKPDQVLQICKICIIYNLRSPPSPGHGYVLVDCSGESGEITHFF